MISLIRSRILLTVFSFVLVACGGGGGGGGGGNNEPPPANGNFNLSTSSLTFTGAADAVISAQYVYLTNLGPDAYFIDIGTPVGVTWPAWLDANLYVTGPNSGYAELRAYTYGMTPGTYSTTLRTASFGNAPNFTLLAYKDVAVTLIVTAASSSSSSSSANSSSSSTAAPALSISPASISLGGNNGRSFGSANTINIAANQSSGNWDWSIQSKPIWLTAISASSGTLNGTTPSSLQFQGNPSGLSAGTYSGSLVLQATVSGSLVTRTVPVTMNVDKRKLIASDVGVALTKTPSWSRLSRTITVTDNFGSGTWTASSDKSWLSVSPSGSSGGSLVLTANPSLIATNTLETATVSISSDDGAAAETVTVGLWNGNSTPTGQTIISGSFTNIAADPVRPWVYVDNDGTTLTIYHLYTGAELGTVTGLSGAGAIEPSPDGKRLYVVTGNSISIIDPITRAIVGSLSNSNTSTTLRHARVNGEGILFASSGRIFKLSSGTALPTFSPGGAALAVSWDGSTLLSQNTGISPGTTTSYAIDYNDVSSLGSFSMSYQGNASGGSNCRDVAITRDLVPKFITACGSPYNFPLFSLSGMASTGVSLPGTWYPNNIKVASDGRIFAGSDSAYGPQDFWVYRPDNSLFASFQVHGYARGMHDRQLVPSGDALMAAALTSEPALHIIAVGPDTTPVAANASASQKPPILGAGSKPVLGVIKRNLKFK